MTEARGWAVVDRGRIDVRTVQHSRIGAMVNWLVVHVGITVRDGTPDGMIEEMFTTCAAMKKARLVEVIVQEMAS